LRNLIDVVHVLGSGEQHARGIALTVLNLATSLDPHRYRLSVIFLRDDGPIGDALRDKGVSVRAIDWQGGRADIAGAMRFARALREMHPAIVHLHAGGMSPRFVSKAAAGARVVVHFHSLAEENKSKRVAKRSPFGADLIIANSHATARSVRRGKPVVIYPGVSVSNRTRNTQGSGRVTIGAAARLTPVKGIGYLVAALSLLRDDFPDLFLEIAGDGPELSKLQQSARQANVERRVTFLGWVNDIDAAMSRWDIVAQPSIAEGLGIAALEAMARGIPVVASDVGGLREIIVDNTTGFLVPPGDSHSIAMKLSELAGDHSLRARMGSAARDHASKNFSLDKESAAIRSAYERLLA
jgi:glycosyltransferase involved in cell wall biosynthesis